MTYPIYALPYSNFPETTLVSLDFAVYMTVSTPSVNIMQENLRSELLIAMMLVVLSLA